MKNVILMFAFILFGMITANAQVVADPTPMLPDFGAYVANFAILVATIPVLTEFFRTKLKVHGLGIQIVSWALGVVLAVIAYFLNLGIFEALELWQSLAVGLGAALAANGVADTGLIQTILSMIPGIYIRENTSN